MSENTRLSSLPAFAVIAALAVLALILFLWATWEVAVTTTEQRLRAQRYAAEFTVTTAPGIVEGCAGLIGRPLVQCVSDALQETRVQQRAEQDLFAQLSMARWAFWMMVLTVGALLATIAGVVLIWRTLLATRDMLQEARAATLAAEEAVDIEREISKRTEQSFAVLERPYIYIQNVSHIMPHRSRGPHIVFTVANLGKLPGTILELRAEMQSRHNARNFEPLDLHPHDNPNSPLFGSPDIQSGDKRPQTVVRVPGNIAVDFDDTSIGYPAPPLPDGQSLYLKIVATYEGPFSGPHETAECWRFVPDIRRFVALNPALYRNRT